MKFILFVEGYTEKHGVPAFLKRYLDPRLRHPVGIRPVRFDGWAELVKDSPIKSRMYLNDPKQKSEILGVIALLDLHGPTFYPSDKKSADARRIRGRRSTLKIGVGTTGSISSLRSMKSRPGF